MELEISEKLLTNVKEIKQKCEEEALPDAHFNIINILRV